jgi:hypothetical protein
VSQPARPPARGVHAYFFSNIAWFLLVRSAYFTPAPRGRVQMRSLGRAAPPAVRTGGADTARLTRSAPAPRKVARSVRRGAKTLARRRHGHTAPYNFVVGEYPIFIEQGLRRAHRRRRRQRYIDMLCGYGRSSSVRRARDQRRRVAQAWQGLLLRPRATEQNALDGASSSSSPRPSRRSWSRRGSDATSCAVRIARAATDRDKILRCGLPRMARLVRRGARRRPRGRAGAHHRVSVRRRFRPRGNARRASGRSRRRRADARGSPARRTGRRAAPGYLERCRACAGATARCSSSTRSERFSRLDGGRARSATASCPI